MSQLNQSRASATFISIYRVLGLFFVLYGFFASQGYGNDDDIYRMLDTWKILIHEGRYVPSRFQGYLIPELVIGFASEIGGFYLANLVSVILSLSTLFIFYTLIARLVTPLVAILSVLVIGTNPYWIIASAISMDYVYGAFFFMLALMLIFSQQFRLAGLVFAMAVSSRITYAPMAAIAFLLTFPYLHDRRLKTRLIQGCVLFCIATAGLYLPAFVSAGMSFSFLGVGPDASGGFLGIVVRFIYKNIYFWGLPVFGVLVVFFVQHKETLLRQIATNPFQNVRLEKLLFHGAFWCILYNQIMFFKLPHEYFYLMPVLFSVSYLIATTDSERKQKYLSLLVVLNLLYGFVFNFDVIQTYQKDTVPKTVHSDSAEIKPSIREGILIRELNWRSIYQKYQLEEFNKRWYGNP